MDFFPSNDKDKSEQLPSEWPAYPVALFAGYNVFETAARKACYKNVATQGLFKDAQAERNVKYQALFREAMEHPGQNAVPKIMEMENDYRLLVRERFQKMGIYTLKDYWNILKRNQKQDVVMLGATVSGVVLGALLTIANHGWVQKIGHAQEKDSQEKGV